MYKTGPVPRIPEVSTYLSKNFFHPGSQGFKGFDPTNKKVVIVGGGQTGSEIYLNALNFTGAKLVILNLSQEEPIYPT